MQRTATLIIGLALLLTACSGLAGEPDIVATRPAATPRPTEVAAPVALPDLASGAQIYAARCASCHGIDGAGEGELVLTGQIPSPGNFTEPDAARDQTPYQWFQTITNGRIENLMPPWAAALSAQERWDVALYTYTQHYDPELIARGAEVWADREIDPDLRDLEVLSITSDAALYDRLRDESLSEDDIWAGVAYVRTQALANADQIGQEPPAPPVATEEVAAEDSGEEAAAAEPAGPGTISGTITNGTAGGETPSDLPVALFVFDAELNQQRFEATAGPDGRFSFSDIPIRMDNAYAVTTVYRDRTFVSEIVGGNPEDPGLTIPLTIYEFTEDPAVISFSGMVYQISAVGEGLQVAQFVTVRNESDRMFTSGREVADGQFASLTLTLPPAAAVMGFPEGGQRFIVSEDQSTIIDTAPVLPGDEHVIQVVYFLPYDGVGAVIEQPLTYPLDGPVRLLLQPQSLEAASPQLTAIGPQTVGESTYTGYGGTLELAEGEVIRFELSGAGAPTAAQVNEPRGGVASNNLLPVVIGVVVIQACIIIVLFMLYSRRRALATAGPGGNDDRVIDALVAQIAELDNQHDRGEINHDLYQQRRAQLKARLAELMDDAE